MAKNRDVSIDILRGVAIITMVALNLAASVLVQPHPFWLRLYGSFAAPLFILISGMMVALTSKQKTRGLHYFLLRGGLLIVAGALIDILIWMIIPFTTVDVLYLIGLSLPVAYLFSRLPSPVRWLLVVLIFAATPVLQTALGYTAYPTEYTLLGQQTVTVANQTGILNHWLVDGWFPIFPWLGFSLLGVNLAMLRWRNPSKRSATHIFGKGLIAAAGLGILLLGAVTWWLYPGSLLSRGGYSELFYPPTIGYMVTAIGLIILLFALVDRNSSLALYKPLLVLGESPLFIYIFHLALIGYVISSIWANVGPEVFLLIYITLSILLVLVALALRYLKAARKNRPFIVRFLLGG